MFLRRSFIACLKSFLADKCLLPYYGGCPLTRECVTSEFDINCGACLPGYAIDRFDPFGECLRKSVCPVVVFPRYKIFSGQFVNSH